VIFLCVCVCVWRVGLEVLRSCVCVCVMCLREMAYILCSICSICIYIYRLRRNRV
jgi:hypothetical protein